MTDRNSARTARLARLPQLLTERILLLDGAMGTMLQRVALSEADYRGAKYGGIPWRLGLLELER